MNILLYYFKESFIGLFRNKSATVASIILIIISLTFSSLLFLLNSNIGDTIHFLESQTKIKVFLKEGTDVKSYEKKLINIHSISSIEYVSSEETLKSMKNMLKDKKHLFTLFSKNDIPDSYLIDVKNRADTTKTIEEIRNIKGTSDTFYPQEFAQKLISFTKKVTKYSIITLVVFAFTSLLTIIISIRLSIFQRQKDIRVKLLLGAKESHVRGQFLLEGAIIGFTGGLFSFIFVFFIYHMTFYQLHMKYSLVFSDSSLPLSFILLILLFGALFGTLGSFLSTRKLINNK